MKLSLKNFFRKCDQIRSFLRIGHIYRRNPWWKTFIFYSVFLTICFQHVIRTLVLNFRWPTSEKNEEIYAKTKLEPLSILIGNRCLKCFCKTARINPSTLTHSALHFTLKESRKPRGRPLKTWLCIMKHQLKQTHHELESSIRRSKRRKSLGKLNLRLSYVAKIVFHSYGDITCILK